MKLCLMRKDINFGHASTVGPDYCIHFHSKLAASCTIQSNKTLIYCKLTQVRIQAQHVACFADVEVLMNTLVPMVTGRSLHTHATDMLQTTMTRNKQDKHYRAGQQLCTEVDVWYCR